MDRRSLLLLALLGLSVLAFVLPAHATSYTITASYSIAGGGTPTAPVLNYYVSGVLTHTRLTTTPTGYSADSGTAWSITPDPLTGSGIHERWMTPGTLSGTVTGAFTVAPVYFHEYQGNVSESWQGTRSTLTNETMSYFVNGTSTTLTLSSAYHSYWFDAGKSWTVPSPVWNNLEKYATATTGATVSAAFKQQIVYSNTYGSANTCSGANPLQLLEQGCVVTAVIDTLSLPEGLQPWFGLVTFSLVVSVFNKSQNVAMGIILLFITGATFQFLIPTYAQSFGEILMILAGAGVMMKLIFKIW